MIVYDPLYGRFSIPSILSTLVMTPEVRRLSQVRLLNTMSPTLATLGELRRYSHTLGVLHLCEKNNPTGYTEEERSALAATVLLHDIGTPPFGHLFEYHLREKTAWSHERIIKSVLWGHHAPENIAHQIFAGRTVEFRSALKKTGISFELVEAIVTGQHPLSLMLFGTIDLDNLDNIVRMAWALGIAYCPDLAVSLASVLGVGRDCSLRLSEAPQRPAIQRWARLRRSVYEVVAFDPPTVAAQAVLSEAIGIGIEKNLLSEEDWWLSDEALVEVLRTSPETKDVMSHEYLGRLPGMAFCLQVSGTLGELGLESRSAAKVAVEEVLHHEFPTDRVLGYLFVDYGTFEKKLTFSEPNDEGIWTEGDTSASVILYGFVRSEKSPSGSRSKRAAQYLVDRFGISHKRLLRYQIGAAGRVNDDQPSLGFASS